jgi:hypothetical protein
VVKTILTGFGTGHMNQYYNKGCDVKMLTLTKTAEIFRTNQAGQVQVGSNLTTPPNSPIPGSSELDRYVHWSQD